MNIQQQIPLQQGIIFHSSVKDGSFRVYSGGRNKADLIDYVEKEKWQADEVLPGWKVLNT